MRSNSFGNLYPFFGTSSASPTALLAHTTSVDVWHRRLGHPNKYSLARLLDQFPFLCNKSLAASPTCEACQKGKHVRLPFPHSMSFTYFPFQIIHCDLWTSPISSISGFQYYLIILDDYTHYVWTFPIRHKSEVPTILRNFYNYVRNQFHLSIQSIQCDNGREFDNHVLRSFLSAHGVTLRLSCPYTSSQNGKAERSIRTVNDILRTLLEHASMPRSYWVEALHTATYLNRRPCEPLQFRTPYQLLFGCSPDYQHLRTFGCLCYPNLSSITPHKLSSRSARCVFLGYPSEHKGYRCLNLDTMKIIISRHVIFDESIFPFATQPATASLPHTFATNPSVSGWDLVPVRRNIRRGPVAPRSPVSTQLPPQPASPAALDASAPTVFSPVHTTACTSPSSHAAGPVPSQQPLSDAHSSPMDSAGTTSSLPSTSSRDVTTPARPTVDSTLTSSPSVFRFAHPAITQHHMTTRAKAGVFQPKKIMNLHATTSSSISPIPSSYQTTIKDPHWYNAMLEEFQALMTNNTWSLVPKPAGANIVTGKWIFRHKLHSDGSLARYKARWVVRGCSQQEGIDYGETFSPVIKPGTIRCVLSIATTFSWPIHLLDVKNAFLHGTLTETVYAQQPSGFVDSSFPHHVCQLHKSLYGLKQAPRTWFIRFTTFLLSIGFSPSKCDSSLFILKTPSATAYLLLYVDDIILTANTPTFLSHIISKLCSQFAMSDLGPLRHFLGIQVTTTATGLVLSQKQYALDILARAHMSNCNPCHTPVDTNSKSSSSTGSLLSQPTVYRSLVGALQYLTLTRPDISYAVQQVCLFMHAPRDTHMALLKRILRYVCGTLDYGLHIYRSPTLDLVAYSDADWAGCPDTRRSTSGYCVFMGDNLVAWSSKRQHTVSRSSAEAEYRGVANVVAELCWLRQLMTELSHPPRRASVVFCDNVSAMYLASNPVQHQRTKHVEIDLHFVGEKVSLGEVIVTHIPSSLQLADIFTKGLTSSLFKDFRCNLQIKPYTDPAG